MQEMVWRKAPADLSDPFFIRETVFMKEQGFQVEFDDIDNRAEHLTLYLDGKPAGCARIFTEADGWHLGRLAVLPAYRKRRLGALLVLEAERQAARLGAEAIHLSAQVRVKDFYKKLGYQVVTGEYFDEFCPHVGMEKRLNAEI